MNYNIGQQNESNFYQSNVLQDHPTIAAPLASRTSQLSNAHRASYINERWKTSTSSNNNNNLSSSNEGWKTSSSALTPDNKKGIENWKMSAKPRHSQLQPTQDNASLEGQLLTPTTMSINSSWKPTKPLPQEPLPQEPLPQEPLPQEPFSPTYITTEYYNSVPYTHEPFHFNTPIQQPHFLPQEQVADYPPYNTATYSVTYQDHMEPLMPDTEGCHQYQQPLVDYNYNSYSVYENNEQPIHHSISLQSVSSNDITSEMSSTIDKKKEDAKPEKKIRQITVQSINAEHRAWIDISPSETGLSLAEKIHVIATFRTRKVVSISTASGRKVPLDNRPVFGSWMDMENFVDGEKWTVEWCQNDRGAIDRFISKVVQASGGKRIYEKGTEVAYTNFCSKRKYEQVSDDNDSISTSSDEDSHGESNVWKNWFRFLNAEKNSTNFHPFSPEKHKIVRCGHGISPRPYLDPNLYKKHLKRHIVLRFPLHVECTTCIDAVLDSTKQDLTSCESVFNHLLVYRFIDSVALSIQNKHDCGSDFIPGEAYLSADDRSQYKADGIIKMINIRDTEILLVETSGSYAKMDKTKSNFDHHKGTFGALAILKTTADEFNCAQIAIFVNVKEGIYELWREDTAVIKPLFTEHQDMLQDTIRFYWTMKSLIEEAVDNIVLLRDSHDMKKKEFRYSELSPPLLTDVANPAILALNQKHHSKGIAEEGPFYN
ncbi:MAG: hypothetical protein EXX96DRAFT_652202 [Benjaminiella poitrasii]|nr:MAG: hypothetical protein EXX96DRAFT_652202 [Benjaminiella poitrasii]